MFVILLILSSPYCMARFMQVKIGNLGYRAGKFRPIGHRNQEKSLFLGGIPWFRHGICTVWE
jgi:hypothetical protein